MDTKIRRRLRLYLVGVSVVVSGLLISKGLGNLTVSSQALYDQFSGRSEVEIYWIGFWPMLLGFALVQSLLVVAIYLLSRGRSFATYAKWLLVLFVIACGISYAGHSRIRAELSVNQSPFD